MNDMGFPHVGQYPTCCWISGARGLRLMNKINNTKTTPENRTMINHHGKEGGHAATCTLRELCLTRFPLVPVIFITYVPGLIFGVTEQSILMVACTVTVPFEGGVTEY